MDYVQNTEYEVRFSDHAKVNLAFRYGIALKSDLQTIFFQRKLAYESALDNRMKCRFHLNGRSVDAVITEGIVATVTPNKELLKTTDARLIASAFDIAYTISPTIFNLEDIVEWREKYLESQGKLKVDDLRRELRRRVGRNSAEDVHIGIAALVSSCEELSMNINVSKYDTNLENPASIYKVAEPAATYRSPMAAVFSDVTPISMEISNYRTFR